MKSESIKKVLKRTIFFVLIFIFCINFTLIFTACDDKSDNNENNVSQNGGNAETEEPNEKGENDDPAQTPDPEVPHDPTPDKPEKVFSVTFYPDNGESPVIWTEGTVPSFEKSDYEFDGWYYDRSLTAAYPEHFFDDAALAENLNAYAKWTKIIKRFENLIFESKTFTFDGKEHSISVENMPVGASVQYDAPCSRTEAGEYNINAAVSAEGYETVELRAVLTINKAKIEGIVFSDKTFVWDGSPKSLEILYTLNGIPQALPEDIDVEYIGNDKSDVGQYMVSVKFDTGNNYLPIAEMTASLTVLPLKISGIVFEDVSYEWDGGTKSAEVKYLADGKICDLPPSILDVIYENNYHSETGVYNVTAKFRTDKNHTLEPMSAKLEIKPAVTKGLVFKDAEFEWDGGVKKIEVIFAPNGKEQSIPDYITVKYIGNGQTETGEYIVTAEFSVPDNYAPIPKMSAKLMIKEKYYTVRFHYSENNTVDVSVKRLQNLENIPIAEEKDGYYCAWDRENFENINENIDVFPVFTPINYSITYNLNGGTLNSEPKRTYTIEDADYLLPTPLLKAHDFAGWYLNSDFTGKPVTEIVRGSAGGKTLYAKFIATVYNLNYVLNGGANSLDNPDTITVDACPLTLREPSFDAHKFIGWYLNPDFSGEAISEITINSIGNKTLYAKFIEIDFILTYELNGGANSPDNPSAFNLRDCPLTLFAPTLAAHEFKGWYDNPNFEGDVITQITKDSVGNKTLYAKFVPIQYTITYILNGGQNSPYNPEKISVTDCPLTLYAPNFENHDFIGWYDDPDFTGDKVFEIAQDYVGNRTLYAKFTAVEYTITYILNGGTNSPKNQDSYSADSCPVTLYAPILDNHDFVGWYDNSDFTGSPITAIAGNFVGIKTLYAKFTPTVYVLNYILQAGQNSPNNPEKLTVKDCPFTLSAPNAPDNFVFKGWYSDEKYTNRIEIITADNIKSYSLYPLFQEKSDLEYSLLPDGTYEVIGVSVDAEEITVPETYKGIRVTGIGKSAFANSSVTRVTMGENILYIGENAFDDCISLKTVVLPSSVSALPEALFKGCRTLVNLTIPFVGAAKYTNGSTSQSGSTQNVYPFGYLFSESEDETYFAMTEQSSITNGTPDGDYNRYIPRTLKNVIVENGDISNGAFQNCASLESVTVKGDGQSVGIKAFLGCFNLKTVYIPAVSVIGGKTVDGCDNLTDIYYDGTESQWNEAIKKLKRDSLLTNVNIKIHTN